MPGLAMDDTTTQPFIKDEEIDSDIFEDEGDDDGSYRPRPQLAKPVVLLRSLAYLMKGMETGLIDVEPEYQREVVWTADRMSGLIDSLMENYYIPPIILNKKTGLRDTMVCVDGKQRLSSVQAFMRGLIPCHDHRGEKWWFCNTTGRARNVLPEDICTAFLAKELISSEFKNLSQEQEEDLFSRVQKGVQLTAAEKMRAATGPWQELGKAFVDDFPEVFSLLKDRARSKDFQQALACFSQIIEVQHPTAANGVPGLKTNVYIVSRFVQNNNTLDDGTRSHLAAVFQCFNRLVKLDPDVFRNTEKKLKGVQTFAPLEMVSVAVLISMYGDERNDRLLLGDIRYLRNLLRENYVDLRMNLPTWKFVWDYIDNLEQVRGAVDGSTIDPHRRKQKGAAGVARAVKGSPAKRTKPGISDKSVSPRSAAPVTSPKRARPDPSSSDAMPSRSAMAKRPSEPDVTQAQKRARVEPEAVIKPEPEPEPDAPTLPAYLPYRSTPGPTPQSHPYRTPAAPVATDPRVPVAPMIPSTSSPLFTPAAIPSAQPINAASVNAAFSTAVNTSVQLPERGAPAPSINANTAPYNPLNTPTPTPTPNQNWPAQPRINTAARTQLVIPAAPTTTTGTKPQNPPPFSTGTYLAQQRVARRTPQSPLRVARRTPQNPLTKAKNPPAPSTPTTSVVSPFDDVIDLTGDMELERQDLLSSFGGRATNERATKVLHAEGGRKRGGRTGA